jgi:hypothetical protein
MTIAKTKPTKVVIKGGGIEKELPLNDPGVYDVFVYPGMLVERTSTNTVRPHSTSAGNASPMFALEMPFIGVNGAFGEGRAFDDPYETLGETVRVVYAQPGSEINAWLAAGSGQDVVVGDLLQSHGDGYLAKYSATTPPPLRPVARALQAVDNDPGTGGAAVRIIVEVL